jgi:MFS family permease
MIAAGFADFSLIGFHLRKAEILSAGAIPVLYAVAMAVAGLAGLVFGRLLDKLGPRTLGPGLFVPAFAAPLVFLGGPAAAVAGVVLWGIGMGVQDTAFKAVLAGVVPKDRRGTAFGVYDTVYGIAWFAGSAAMGVLHDVSLPALVAFSVVAQLAALPILYVAAGAPALAARRKR